MKIVSLLCVNGKIIFAGERFLSASSTRIQSASNAILCVYGGMGEAKGPVLLLGVAAAAAGAPLPSQLCKNPTEPQARVFHKAAFILAAAGVGAGSSGKSW